MRRPVELDGTGERGKRTALKTIRGLGSAREGTEHFIQQRLTALANAVLILVLAVVAIALSGKSYEEAVDFVGSVWVAVPLGLAVISVAYHMKLGLQIIIEDYIHKDGTRILLLVGNTFFAMAVGAIALFSIVKIMLAALTTGAGLGVG